MSISFSNCADKSSSDQFDPEFEFQKQISFFKNLP